MSFLRTFYDFFWEAENGPDVPMAVRGLVLWAEDYARLDEKNDFCEWMRDSADNLLSNIDTNELKPSDCFAVCDESISWEDMKDYYKNHF